MIEPRGSQGSCIVRCRGSEVVRRLTGIKLCRLKVRRREERTEDGGKNNNDDRPDWTGGDGRDEANVFGIKHRLNITHLFSVAKQGQRAERHSIMCERDGEKKKIEKKNSHTLLLHSHPMCSTNN